MILYMSLLAMPLVLRLFFPGLDQSKRKKIAYLAIVFTVLFFFAAFRSTSVGKDTILYYKCFKQLGGIDFWDSFTHVYHVKINLYSNVYFTDVSRNYEMTLGIATVALYQFCSRIFGSYQCVLIISSLITSISFAIYTYRYSQNVTVSSFIYAYLIYGYTMNLTRQYLAISIALFAITAVLRKKTLKAAILFIIAGLIHTSTFTFIPLLILSIKRINLNTKTTIVLTIVFAFAARLGTWLMPVFGSLFSQYSYYLNSGQIDHQAEYTVWSLVCYGLVLICGLYVVIKERKQPAVEKPKTCDDERVAQYRLSLLMFAIYWGLMFVANTFFLTVRVMQLFSVSCTTAFPAITENIVKNKKVKALVYALMVLVFGYLAYKTFDYNGNSIIPYRFFWQ